MVNRVWQLIRRMTGNDLGWREPMCGPDACSWFDADGPLASVSLTVDGYLRITDDAPSAAGRVVLEHGDVEEAVVVLVALNEGLS